MIDFNKFDLTGLDRFLASIPTSVDNGERFEIGIIIEFALEAFSNGLLKRINENGKDLIGIDGKSYESKKVSFKNKSGMDVRGVILRNGMSDSFADNYIPADYYIFTDSRKRKVACVSGNRLYGLKSNSSMLTGKCNLWVNDFILHGDLNISDNRDYMKEKQVFLKEYIQSFKTDIIGYQGGLSSFLAS